jgi:tRNA/rRNA methyltransferase
MAIYFVLVKPAVAGNIGAAARAIKTMGFKHLRIVGSQQHRQKKARILAHGAGDILDNSEYYDDLPAALADIDWAVGTSAKRRLGKRYSYSAPQLKTLIEQKQQSLKNIAIVFGCEESGLSNEQLACCDALTSIPIAHSYPSLNLSQAVMIYAYSLTDLRSTELVEGAVDSGSWKVLKQRVADYMEALNISVDDKVHRWAMERLSVLDNNDIKFFHLLLSRISKGKGGKPPPDGVQ